MVYSVRAFYTEKEAAAWAKKLNKANKENGLPSTWRPVIRYGRWCVGRDE